jgi:hypothetical protein
MNSILNDLIRAMAVMDKQKRQMTAIIAVGQRDAWRAIRFMHPLFDSTGHRSPPSEASTRTRDQRRLPLHKHNMHSSLYQGHHLCREHGLLYPPAVRSIETPKSSEPESASRYAHSTYPIEKIRWFLWKPVQFSVNRPVKFEFFKNLKTFEIKNSKKTRVDFKICGQKQYLKIWSNKSCKI